jgi:hypothetical protein
MASQLGCLRRTDLLAEPIAEIMNSSFSESRLPPSWKEADIVPVPKQRIVKDVCKHLRPISLTPIHSKVAEEFVIQEYAKPAVLTKIRIVTNLTQFQNHRQPKL